MSAENHDKRTPVRSTSTTSPSFDRNQKPKKSNEKASDTTIKIKDNMRGFKKSKNVVSSLLHSMKTTKKTAKSIFDNWSSAGEEDEILVKIRSESKEITSTIADVTTPIELIGFPDLSAEEEQLFQLIETGQHVAFKEVLSHVEGQALQNLSTKRNSETTVKRQPKRQSFFPAMNDFECAAHALLCCLHIMRKWLLADQASSINDGDTLFHSAVRRHDVNIIRTLLDEVPNTEQILYDILLVAVNLSNKEIGRNILGTIKSNPNLQVQRGQLCQLPKWKYSEFDAHMTPIMMAAIVGNYELIALFSAEGEQLEPHLCYNARTGRTTKTRTPEESEDMDNCSEDNILDDYQRLNEYQALTNPQMICFLANTTNGYDPLQKTFHYINELKYVKSREVEFSENYQELIDNLKKFSIHLMSMCGSSQELDLFFSRPEGNHGRHDRYPRITQALEMGLKEFVSHPYTQRALYNQWAGQDWNEWRYFSTQSKFITLVNRIFCIPAILVSVFLDQGGKDGKLLSCPLHRCLYSAISHCVFLLLALIEHFLESSQPNERMPANLLVEIALVLIVAGKIRALMRHLFFAPHDFARVLWNWYEIIYCCLFCVCFTCWFLLYSSRKEEKVMRRRLPLERQFWKANDLLMIADIFLALGTIMACGQLLRYVQLHNRIGPIQIALGEMLKSFANFAFFFLVILSAFSLGLTAIYAPYKGMENSVTGEVQSGTFTKHSSALIEMYWDLFGGADPFAAELVTISVTDPNNPGRTEQYQHYITELTGKILYSVYSFFGPTILFSAILIGFISRTFGNILEENDVNWRFHRAQIWMYFARASVLPPPFNLIPSVWDVTNFFRTIRDVRQHPQKYFIMCNCASCFHLDNKLTPEDKQKCEEMYFNLIKVLIRRYFGFKKSLKSKELASIQAVAALHKEMEDLKAIANQNYGSIKSVTKQNSTHNSDEANINSGIGKGESDEITVVRRISDWSADMLNLQVLPSTEPKTGTGASEIRNIPFASTGFIQLEPSLSTVRHQVKQPSEEMTALTSQAKFNENLQERLSKASNDQLTTRNLKNPDGNRHHQKNSSAQNLPLQITDSLIAKTNTFVEETIKLATQNLEKAKNNSDPQLGLHSDSKARISQLEKSISFCTKPAAVSNKAITKFEPSKDNATTLREYRMSSTDKSMSPTTTTTTLVYNKSTSEKRKSSAKGSSDAPKFETNERTCVRKPKNVLPILPPPPLSTSASEEGVNIVNNKKT